MSGARRGKAKTGCWRAGAHDQRRPILANDPHLQIEFPSVWYEMHSCRHRS